MNSFLVWKSNGTASKRFQRTLKDILVRHKPSVLGLLEPKVSGAHADIICNGLGFDRWQRVEALGYNSGIWIQWKNSYNLDVVKCEVSSPVCALED